MTHQTVLGGLRVTEFSWIVAGPYSGELLALLGAEVIRIESRDHADMMRRRPTSGMETSSDNLDSSLKYSAINLNKRSIALDLGKPQGRDLAMRIVQQSDVAVENFRPGVLHRLGLDYEALRAVNPALVMLSISARGQTSPERLLPGYASVFAAVGGVSHLTGYPDGPPIGMRIPFDYNTGTMAALAIFAALLERQDTGRGRYIDLSATDVASSFMGDVLLDYSLTERVHTRQGNRHPSMAPHNCYPCRGDDQWVTIAVADEPEWQSLCRALGSPDWTRESIFQDARSRWLQQEKLDQHLAEWTRQRTAKEAMDLLQSYGVAATPSFSMLELSRDPHIHERQVFVDVDHPVLGKHKVMAAPWKLSGTPAQVHRAGPLLGEHTRPVLQELLGLSEEEVDRLAAEGVLE